MTNFNRRVFVAIPQLRELPLEEVLPIAAKTGLSVLYDYKMGLHPAVENSLRNIQGIEHKTVCKWSLSIVDQARTGLFGLWYKAWEAGDKYDYFLTLDSDISFPPGAIAQLIDRDLPLVGGTYAVHPTYLPKKFEGTAILGGMEGEQVQSDGLIKVKCLGGGFVLCRSDFLLSMIDHYPELECLQQWEPGATNPEERYHRSWALWLPMLYQPEDNGPRYYTGEDFSFCHRTRAVGFDVWLDLTIPLIHWEGSNPLMVNYDKIFVDPKKDEVIV